ncbi:MAG: Rho termination factor N-terminal domain-containing protein [Clostridia bacterium]|nr:Rho termination factor N-terminal domain-containing protein [Clostridia bacterium]
MTRKEILQDKTCPQLRAIAKELDIIGRWDMTKPQLVEAILGAEKAKNADKISSANDEVKIDNLNADGENKKEKESPSKDANDSSQKMSYVENAEVGTLVAFKLSNGKVKSAKIIRKSSKNRKLKLETDYGAQYIVSYDDIIWVRTGRRWPKGVYRLLKGLANNNEENTETTKVAG